MALNEKLAAAIAQSRDYAIRQMTEAGVPVGVDALRVDITLHTARGWQPTVIGEIVQIPDEDLPEPSRASHSSS